jgi:hypothetical protein
MLANSQTAKKVRQALTKWQEDTPEKLLYGITFHKVRPSLVHPRTGAGPRTALTSLHRCGTGPLPSNHAPDAQGEHQQDICGH